MTDPNGTLSFVNRYALEYLRFPELELLALDFPQARPDAAGADAVRKTVAEPWRQASTQTFETETIITARDGVPRRFLTRCRPVHDASGRIEGFIGLSLPLEPLEAERSPGNEAFRPETLNRAEVPVQPETVHALRGTGWRATGWRSTGLRATGLRGSGWLEGLLASLTLLVDRVRPEES